jgi:SAM-dependent methyltransferase
MRLNLGCCDTKFHGFLGVDVCGPADIIADLRESWPWPDSSVEEVIARDVFEHLPDKRHTMNELWRVLKPGGKATLQIPHATLGDGGHCDPTHVSYWTTSDFEYYTPGIAERERFRNSAYYGVKADFRVTNLTKPGSRQCVQCCGSTGSGTCIGGHIPTAQFARTYGGHVVEMEIILEAVK